MACEIIDVKVKGRNLNGVGVPTAYAVTARVLDCKFVEIKVTTTGGALIFHDPAFDVSSGTLDGAGYNLIDAPLATGEAMVCGTELQVEVTCVAEPACHFKGPLPVDCDECPTAISIIVAGVAGPLEQDADCVPPGDYIVTVIDPVGPTVNYDWQVNTPTGMTSSSGPANSITVTVPPGAGDGDYVVFVSTDIPDCTDLMAGYFFPASNAGVCPEDLTIVVRKNGTDLPPPYTNLAPGDYEIVVTEPASADGYDFTENSGAPSQIGASPVYTATLSAGETLEVIVAVDNGPCCPELRGTVDLEAAADPPDDTVPGGENDDDPPDDTIPGGGTDDDDDEDDGNGGWTLNICAALAAIAIGALLLALVLGLLFFCALPIGLPAILIALAVSAAAFLLLMAFCRWNPCRVIGAIAWCFMWGLLIGVVIAAFCLSLIVLIVAIGYAIVAGLLVLWLRRMGCPIPQPFRWP